MNKPNEPPRCRPNARRILVAITIGNALEWYDIAIYSFFVLQIARAFFPADDPNAALLLALASVAVSFLARPVGAVLFGHLADRHGRRSAMQATLLTMMAGTALITFMPTHAQIGILATVLIVLGRILQGLSAGGEFGSSTALLAELNTRRRGALTSWQFASQGLCSLLASLFGLILTTTLSVEQLQDWGWRLAFGFGLLVGPAAYLLRRDLVSEPRLPAQSFPLTVLLSGYKAQLAICICLIAVSTAVNWFLVYLPTYVVTELRLDQRVGFICTMLAGLVATILTPVVGRLSDRVPPAALMLAAALVLMATFLPCFLLLFGMRSLNFSLAVVLWLSLVKVCYTGALAGLLSSLFPTQIRATALSLGYNFGVILFGGTAPFMMMWLRQTTGDPLAPAYYLMGIAILSLVAVSLILRHPRRWLLAT